MECDFMVCIWYDKYARKIPAVFTKATDAHWLENSLEQSLKLKNLK